MKLDEYNPHTFRKYFSKPILGVVVVPNGSGKSHLSSTIATLFIYSASIGKVTVSAPSNGACSMDKEHGDISRG
jgi:Fe-S cluster assembly ATPase SufC